MTSQLADHETVLNEVLSQLESAQITYFPIRHHSPACSRHLTDWIRENNPCEVLVEGPETFNRHIPLLVDSTCQSPVAIYTSFTDKQQRLIPNIDMPVSDDEKKEKREPARYAAYYPFCDYSPELVAMREGQKINARLQFIDLPYGEMLLSEYEAATEKRSLPRPRIISLADDPHLRHSQYIQALVRRTGCRDFNEVWDHLFEASEVDRPAFMRHLATYCVMARMEYDQQTLELDGTIAREDCMAGHILTAIARRKPKEGPILVVTGGFHTAALPALVKDGLADDSRQKRKRYKLAENETGDWLIRYSFEQLDALNGYAAGLPNPGFYDAMWHSDHANHDYRFKKAAELLVELGRITRERNLPNMISTADVIAAVKQMKHMTRLRGHASPQREDILDAIRSCFVKGEIKTEGAAIFRIVHQMLAGDRVGQVPAGTPLPPIVDDFRQQTCALRLPLDDPQARELNLDLYRKKRHRQISRLLNQLDHLSIPYATFLSGPDFVHGGSSGQLIENWRVQWSPASETALIESAIYGPTVKDAASGKLGELIDELKASSQGRSSQAAVKLLTQALRMGLHQYLPELLEVIDNFIEQDPEVTSLVSAMSELDLLIQAREPLEARELSILPQLRAHAYQRACHLCGNSATCPDELVGPIIDTFIAIRELLAGQAEVDEDVNDDENEDAGVVALLDIDLFHDALLRVCDHPADQAQSAVVGAAAGILFARHQISEDRLLSITCGYLNGTGSHQKAAGILRGLLATAREIAWHVKAIMQAIDEQFNHWDEKMFMEVLPELRLAFTNLTPREITRVAEHIAGLHGQADLGALVHVDMDEQDMQFGLALNQLVGESLVQDGLATSKNEQEAKPDSIQENVHE